MLVWKVKGHTKCLYSGVQCSTHRCAGGGTRRESERQLSRWLFSQGYVNLHSWDGGRMWRIWSAAAITIPYSIVDLHERLSIAEVPVRFFTPQTFFLIFFLKRKFELRCPTTPPPYNRPVGPLTFSRILRPAEYSRHFTLHATLTLRRGFLFLSNFVRVVG